MHIFIVERAVLQHLNFGTFRVSWQPYSLASKLVKEVKNSVLLRLWSPNDSTFDSYELLVPGGDNPEEPVVFAIDLFGES